MEARNSKKDASEAQLSKAKGESLTEEVCDKMEEKEKKKCIPKVLMENERA